MAQGGVLDSDQKKQHYNNMTTHMPHLLRKAVACSHLLLKLSEWSKTGKGDGLAHLGIG